MTMQQNVSSPIDTFVYLSPAQLEILLERLRDSDFVVGKMGHIYPAKRGVEYPVNEGSIFRPQLPAGFLGFHTDGKYYTAQLVNRDITFPGAVHTELQDIYQQTSRGRQYF